MLIDNNFIVLKVIFLALQCIEQQFVVVFFLLRQSLAVPHCSQPYSRSHWKGT